MQQLWKRFEAWLSDHAPHLLGGLRDGATPRQLAQAETALQVRFPKDLRDSYAVHDGQDHPDCFALYSGALFASCPLLPLSTVVRNWSVLKGLHDCGDFDGARGRPAGPIREDWWHPRWIPLTANAAGDHPVCVDLAPAAGGRRGQVISWWHDDPNRRLLGRSFRHWFANYLAAVEAGEYVYSEQYGGIVDRNDV
jgi:cell wall assembly regulator SMI1